MIGFRESIITILKVVRFAIIKKSIIIVNHRLKTETLIANVYNNLQ